jgi:hypothetical protein
MTRDLSPDQPADAPETLPAEAPTEAQRIVTVITVDSVPVRVSERGDGSLVIQPGSRNPLVFDRWQRIALLGALSEGE